MSTSQKIEALRARLVALAMALDDGAKGMTSIKRVAQLLELLALRVAIDSLEEHAQGERAREEMRERIARATQGLA
jgi:hypothetical protein